MPCQAVATRFHYKLICAVMRIWRKFTALTRFKIHIIRTFCGRIFFHQTVCILELFNICAEWIKSHFTACYWLKAQIHRNTLLKCLDLSWNVRKNAYLRWDFKACFDIVKKIQNIGGAFDGINSRIKSYYRIACAVGKALKQRRSDALYIIGWMIGLKARRKCADLTDSSVASSCNM